ncbi:MAG: virulence factor SrfC family protein [Geminicoccaceae bacterium]
MDRATLLRSLEDLDHGAQSARDWIDELRPKSASVAQQADSLIDAGRRARLASRRLAHAATRNNCVGVFGPSQAGKSYLVSALARPLDGRLAIRLGDGQRDFLRDINPPGDRESTGLVTRFTIHGSDVDPDYPVEVRLLTEIDLVKIFANSFFLDFDPNSMTIDPLEEEDIRAALQEAEQARRGPAPSHLDEIALFDLTLYFRQNFKSRIGAFDRTDFWHRLITLAGGLALEQRAALFSLLWGRIPEFTSLFIHLVGALDAVDHATDAQVALAGIIPREAGSPPEPNSVIDVAVLSRLRSERDAQDQIQLRPIREGKAGAATSLPRATLAALIAEISLSIVDQPWPFFEHTDLLDFPGARSRLKLLQMPPEPSDREDQLRELFLRGKIAYLFQRYTDELELTSMLLCMPPSVNEVKDLAGMVGGWIAATHGATAEKRKAVRNSLFLVLTKHDLEFVEKGGETEKSRLGKWDRRLHSSLIELYGKDGWPADWDGEPFSNTFFLRNPGMKQVHLMRYADEAALVEESPVTNDAFSTYQRAFLSSSLTAKHFGNREAVWNAAMEPNDGGIRYLVDNLVEVLDPGLKQTQAAERLVDAAQAITAPLRGLYHAEGDEERKLRDEKLVKLRRELHAAFQRSELRAFAHFRRAMMVSAADVRGTFLNTAALREELSSQIENGKAQASTADDPWAPMPATDAPPTEPVRRERPEIFADRLINLWAGQLRALQQDDVALAELGLTPDIAGQVIDELLVGVARCGLAKTMADLVRRETQSAGTRWVDAADRVTQVAAMRLNDFVAYLSFAGIEASDRPGFPEPPHEATRAIFSHDGLDSPGIEIGATPELLERIAFVDWGVALRSFGNANVGHSAGREISDEQNRRLGAIIDQLDISSARP